MSGILPLSELGWVGVNWYGHSTPRVGKGKEKGKRKRKTESIGGGKRERERKKKQITSFTKNFKDGSIFHSELVPHIPLSSLSGMRACTIDEARTQDVFL